MPMLRTTVLIDLPEGTVTAALTEQGVLAGLSGVRVLGAVEAHPSLLAGTVIAGRIDWLPVRGLSRQGVLSAAVTPAGEGAMLVATFDLPTPGGRLGELVAATMLRRRMLGVLDSLCDTTRTRAWRLAALPVVVGTAIVSGSRVLVQQRGYPAAHAERWELPGGRVEAGESERQAVVRECVEELGVEVVVGGRVGADVPLDGGLLLRVYAAELADPGAKPRSHEHRAVRWVSAAELDALDWLDADRALLPALHNLLD